MPSSTPAILPFSALLAFEWTDTPMWVFDLDAKCMRWANSAGLAFWNATSLEEFLARDFSDLSPSAIIRNQTHRDEHAAGRFGRDQWTVYPRGEPTTLNAHTIGVDLDNGTRAILYEATQVATPLDPSVLRGVEAMQHTPLIIALHRLSDGSVVMRNPSGVHSFGLTDEPGRRNDFADMFVEPAQAEAVLVHVRNGKVDVTEAELKTLHGPRWYRLEVRPTLDPVTGEPTFQLNAQDVTERKLAEAALVTSEQRWKFAIEGTGDGLWDWNIQTGKTFFSTRYKAMLGFADHEFGDTADAWTRRIHPEDAPGVTAALQPFMDGQPGSARVEFRMKRKDGSWMWTLGCGMVVERNAQGKPLRMIGTNSDISARKVAEETLQESEVRLRTVVESTREAIAVHQNGIVVFVNPATVQMLGASGVNDLVGKPMLDFVHPACRPLVIARLKAKVEHGLAMPLVEEKFIRLDGRVIDVEVQGAPIVYMGKPAVQVAMRDITEHKIAEERLRLAASFFENSRESLMILDAEGALIEVNSAFSRITGYTREEAIGHFPHFLNSGQQEEHFYEAMWDALAEQGHWSGEVWNRRKTGEVYAEMLTISAVRDAAGRTQQYVGLASDITALKEHQRRLEHIAHFDALTNLPNRVLLADRLHQGMVQAQRRGKHLAIAYLDLDGFKAINDQHGHDAGDQVLVTLAQRMKLTLREGDSLARLGGDEFVAVLIDLESASACLPLLNRLLTAASHPVQLGDLTLQVSASVGVTFYPQDQDIEADQLLRQADQAMYQAKLAGKNRFHFFDTEHDRSLRGHHESLKRIRLALDRGEFVLYYQPKVNMRTSEVIGAEALIRWRHPDKGLLLPAVFLSEIEDHPLAEAIGEWVIDSALTQMELWNAVGLCIPVSVNVGARQFQQKDFVNRLRSILQNHPAVGHSRLEVEVLETSALEDIGQVAEVIEACAQLGVSFALDDFGTGYSSLTYLKRLRVNMLKIDKSFVRDMLIDPDDLSILKGVIGLASAFRRDVIAEGVETGAHGRALLELGCEQAQGFGIARPMPADQLPTWAAAWQVRPNWVDGSEKMVLN